MHPVACELTFTEQDHPDGPWSETLTMIELLISSEYSFMEPENPLGDRGKSDLGVSSACLCPPVSVTNRID